MCASASSCKDEPPNALRETWPARRRQTIRILTAMSQLRRLRLPEQLPEPISHFTDAVIADGWLWISGMIAVDKAGNLIGGDDVVAQTQRVFENIKAVLEAADA